MISASDRYKAALRHSHESVVEVIAYEGDTELGPLPVSSVTLTLDSGRDVQRTADIVVGVDPITSVERDVLESITTQRGRVVIKHGISFGGELIDPAVTIATLRVDQLTATLGGATRQFRCYDRTMLLQEYGLVTARPLNDTYVNLIQTLVAEAIPGETVSVHATVNTTLTPAPGKSFSRGDDRLRKIQELAEAIGAWLVCLPDGSFSLQPAPGSTTAGEQPVQWAFDTGAQGVLIDSTNTFSRREQYNAVGLEFTPATDAEWSAFVFLWDNDPNSPTYFDGDFGRRPVFFTEEYDHLPSATEAEEVARRKLYEYSGLTRAIQVSGIYNPLLLPGDKITVDVQQTDGSFAPETHFVDSLEFRLGTAASMSLDTRLSRRLLRRLVQWRATPPAVILTVGHRLLLRLASSDGCCGHLHP